jgi:nicotinamidase-related amidase
MENNRTALLVMDMQSGILSRLPEKAGLIAKVAEAIKNARKNNVMVIFVRLGFQRNMPEINPANKSFGPLKKNLSNADLDTFMQIDPDLGVEETDIIVNKKRISAFSGSDLEIILRSQGISSLVLSGIATSGIVLSTVREAFDKDYQLTVLSDGCLDADAEVHRFLIEKIFPRQAEVLTVKDWCLKLL